MTPQSYAGTPFQGRSTCKCSVGNQGVVLVNRSGHTGLVEKVSLPAAAVPGVAPSSIAAQLAVAIAAAVAAIVVALTGCPFAAAVVLEQHLLPAPQAQEEESPLATPQPI